jgi:hypothetical protein
MNYTLQSPIKTNDGSTVKSVEIKTVKVRHLKAAEAARKDGDDMMAGIALIAAVTELPVDVVEEMDARDFTALSEKLADFLPKPASGA